jgi:hypothetical protein
VVMFSIIEQRVQETLRHFTKLDPIIANCILPGTGITAALDQLKRIAKATNWRADRKYLLNHLAQDLGRITRFRNDILHYGITGASSDTAVVTNEKYAIIKDHIRTTKISVPILDEMSAELIVMMIRIAFIKGDISLDDFVRHVKGEISLDEYLRLRSKPNPS